MKVLIVCEDHSLDQYVAKPIVERALVEVGATGSVRVLTDPRLQGVSQLLQELPGILADAMEQIVVVVVDNDCDRERTRAKLSAAVASETRVVMCCAIEEVETWMLALHREQLGESWAIVRSNCDVKEAYAVPFLKRTKRDGGVGRGRKDAMRSLARNWRSLLELCPELRVLCADLSRVLGSSRKS